MVTHSGNQFVVNQANYIHDSYLCLTLAAQEADLCVY